ncbi:MAG: hypothetical protein QXQ11_09615 [Candidatus Bathyarchaeia archaeon]
MRGTPIPEPSMVFTLKDGFKAFSSSSAVEIEKPVRFQPRPDAERYFSIGSPSLDEVLGGGYPRGFTVLIQIDENVPYHQYHLLVHPTAWNFITQGRGVIYTPQLA